MNRPRSTPLRLTATLVVVFVLFTLAGYAAAYLVIRTSLSREVNARLEQTVDALRAIAEPDEIRERIGEIVAGAQPRDLLLRYTVPGEPVLGNLPAPIRASPYSVIGHDAITLPPSTLADSYLAWHGGVGKGRLTLLVGRDSLNELGETFAQVLLFSLVPALLLITAIGALVARRARDRVEAIRSALARLTSGHHDARVTISGAIDDDLGQIGVAVNRMAEAQEASMEALRQVSADVAHDLRTPIQRVAVLLERLDDCSLTDSARGTVAEARAETAHIVATFQSLLQIAQLEGGQARASFAPVDLASLVTSLADVYEPAGEESGHRLEARVSGSATVSGDRTLLGRLIANLIENALRHTPPGRIQLIVEGDPSPVLRVIDDGPGIPEGERSRVLRRLYRMERSRTSEGSGLGLSLVAAIAELHEATLTLEDAGPGLRVSVRFWRLTLRAPAGVIG